MARPRRRIGNLPAEGTSFVGRRRELAEVRKKLGGGRLVTLVGPGGVGKSRLAIRIAADLGRGFRHGAWLIELAEVQDPALIEAAAMSAVGLRDQAATEPRALLLSYLRDRELLLVVDNSEHLIGAAAVLVAGILNAAPGVRVLATSREPLKLAAEQVVPVPPLELPPADQPGSLAQLRESEAVMLFSQRAAAAAGSFELTDLNQTSVAELCRRLDGLPLAIELAAVRTRVLSVDQILTRLADRFALLTGGSRAALPRHQTLRTTMDWSYDLLDASESTVLRRLCVFAGRFTLEDVEAVCTSDDVPSSQALPLLSSLVDKSLVTKEEAGLVAAYRLHETVREYGRLRSQEAGEAEALAQRCAGYYRARCGQSMPDAQYRLVEWLEWTDLEIDNIRFVLRRCLDRGDVALGTDLAISVGWYWVTRATTEGIRWLEDLLGRGSGNLQAQAWACHLRGFLGILKADTSASQWLARAAEASRTARMPTLTSHALSMASVAECFNGNMVAAARLLDQAESATAGVDDLPATVSLLQARCLNGFFDRDLETVTSASSEGVRLSRKVGLLYQLEMMLINLGIAAMLAQNLEQSKAPFLEALHIAQQIDHRVAQYYLLDLLGRYHAATGQTRLAARLMGAAEKIQAETGARMLPMVATVLAPAQVSVMAALEGTKHQAELQAGRHLERDEAIRLALEEPAPLAASAPQDGEVGLLGKREAEVAGLVAEGLSNRQIGAQLFISERTVDGHVRNILNKLGFSSRAQIAGWMARLNRR